MGNEVEKVLAEGIGGGRGTRRNLRGHDGTFCFRSTAEGLSYSPQHFQSLAVVLITEVAGGLLLFSAMRGYAICAVAGTPLVGGEAKAIHRRDLDAYRLFLIGQ